MKADNYDDDVFINCPFDEEYRPLFEAIVFAVTDCGFRARCALEIDDSGQVRIEKILKIIGECRLGIHDISRTGLDKGTRLPRFNMPLELGMFLGARKFGGGRHKEKRCLILDSEANRYDKFISDISGQDIGSHEDSWPKAVALVRDFLWNAATGSVIIPGGPKIAERYEAFQTALPLLCQPFGFAEGSLSYKDYTMLAVAWLKENPRPDAASPTDAPGRPSA